ncbi:MAG TPA: hypothetical protein VM262_01830 [Acidimicrobiales bacterium]|nr:hypothetical protein [Acidimicrobiales bacterium]
MQPTHRLRTILRANAAISGAAALTCLLFASPVGDLLGTDRTGIVRLVGAGLALFALDVALLSRARDHRLAVGTRAVAVVDAAWTVAMAGLALSGALAVTGVVLVLATAFAAAAFAWFEWTGASRLSAKPSALGEVYA